MEYKYKLPRNSTKDLEEAPDSEAAENGDRQVVIPSKKINDLAGRGRKARPQAHDAKSQPSRDGGLRLRHPDGLAQTKREAESPVEHEKLVTRERALCWGQPAPEKGGRSNAHEEGGRGAG